MNMSIFYLLLCGGVLAVQGMKQLGCYNDGINRDLSGPHTRLDRQNTPEVCVDFCLAKGTLYAGVQNGDECFCGNSYGKHGSTRDTRCNRQCTGDSTKTCGGLICNYTMACWSINAQPRFCPVNGADKLVNVTVTSHTCGPRQVYDIRHIYGVQGVVLWVVYGCHVTFNLCYIPLESTTTTSPTSQHPPSTQPKSFNISTVISSATTSTTHGGTTTVQGRADTSTTHGGTTTVHGRADTSTTHGGTTTVHGRADTSTTHGGPTTNYGKSNPIKLQNEGSGGVSIPVIIVPVAVVVCIGFAVVLIVILRKRCLKTKPARHNHISLPRRDNADDDNENNEYDSLQDRLAQEHNYSDMERSTRMPNTARPNHIPLPRRDYIEDDSQNNAYDLLQDRLTLEHNYSAMERWSTRTQPSHSSSQPTNDPVATVAMNDEQGQSDQDYMNVRPDYTNESDHDYLQVL